MSTAGDIRERLEALVVQIDGVTSLSPNYECAIAESALPSFVIRAQGATRQSPSSDQLEVTRNFLLMLMVTKLCDDKPAQEEQGREDCEDFLDSVPEFFAKHPRLENNDPGLTRVIRCSLLTDDGPQVTTWSGDKFSAVLFRLSVTIRKSI